MKKIGAAFIAASIGTVCFCTPQSVSAEGENPVLSLNAGYGAENDITEVGLEIEGNNGVSAYSVRVSFDPKVLEFVSADCGEAFSDGVFYCNDEYSEDCIRIVWSDSRDNDSNGEMAVLRFKTANDTAETKTALSLGYSEISSDLEMAEFATENAELRIGAVYAPGDVNMDGIVDVADVVALNTYLLQGVGDTISYTAQGNAEVSGDKAITTADSTVLLNRIVMITEE